MNPFPQKATLGILLLFVPIMLVLLAVPRFVAGIAQGSLEFTTDAMIRGQALPLADYRTGAASLSETPADDGETEAVRAELMVLGDGSRGNLNKAQHLVAKAIENSPTNPRAWTLLCGLEAEKSPAKGVACLDTGFSVAPYDWYVAEWRMRLVASEWPYLDENLRDAAADRILPMWRSTTWNDDSTLRYALMGLARSAGGRQLLIAGFATDKEALRSFNRWIIEERLHGH